MDGLDHVHVGEDGEGLAEVDGVKDDRSRLLLDAVIYDDLGDRLHFPDGHRA